MGEISYVLKKRWGRNVPSSPVVSGTHIASFRRNVGGSGDKGGGNKRGDDNNDHDDKEDEEDKEEREYRSVRQSVLNFEVEYGRRPRILVVKMGRDCHDRISRVISSGCFDLGFDINVGLLFSTPGGGGRSGL